MGQPSVRKSSKALLAKHWAMVIDTRKLQHEEDLEPLIEACHKPTTCLTSKTKTMKSSGYGKPITTTPSRQCQRTPQRRDSPPPFLVLCNHCENPPCVRACPTQATFKRESDGIVLMDFHRCIGCRFCMAACPFGSRSFNFRDPRPFIKEQNKAFPTRMKGVVEKCNFCAERLAVGEQPACVEASNGAIVSATWMIQIRRCGKCCATISPSGGNRVWEPNRPSITSCEVICLN
jgi:Fe-S-cluster-containing dehydrogenase component